MLALTECHARGHRVAAAAINNPILDWVTLDNVHDPVASKKLKSSKKLSLPDSFHDGDVQLAIEARSKSFHKPEGWFDSFASPSLFFRSAGADIPKEDFATPLDEFQELSLLDQQDFMRQQLKLSTITHNSSLTDSYPDQPDDNDASQEVKKPRRTAKRYPKIDSGLSLPNFLITTSESGTWHDQAVDFTHMVRRSMMRTDELKHKDPVASRLHAEQRMHHHFHKEEGKFWHRGWEHGIASVARWFREVL